MNISLPSFSLPEPSVSKQCSKPLAANVYRVLFGERLSKKRGSKTMVHTAIELKNRGSKFVADAVIRRLSSPFRDDCSGAVLPKRCHQPADLASGYFEPHGGVDLAEVAVADSLEGPRTLKFGLGHGQELHRGIPWLLRTSLLC